MGSFIKRKIGTLGRVVTGKTPSTANDQFFGGPYPFITIPDLDGRAIIGLSARTLSQAGADAIKSSLLPAGSVMMSCIATVGRCGITSRTSFTNQQINSVIPNDDVDPQFLYYVFREIGHELELSGGGGSVYTNVSKSRFSDIEVPIPPLLDQRAITATLGALDDKIELNRKMNATLEAMARALFRDWFVDFGPTRAKMEGGAPYLSPDIWSLFPDRLDDEGKPQGWVTGILGAVATAKNEGVDPSSIHPDTPYIGLEHMPRGSVALNDWEGAGKVTSAKAAFAAGDFLFGKLRPYFHKVGIAPIAGICSTDIVVVRPKVMQWSGFVIACISGDEFVAYTDKTSTGTKMPRTSWTIMAKYPVVLPSSQLAEAFNATVGPMLDCIRANIHASRTLASTRDLLLPRLMSGELRVADLAPLDQENAA